MFRPQSALLTLYGDYALQPRGKIGIGSVVKLLNNLGLSEQEPMYTKRESEFLQQYIAQHGQMPGGNRELEDLF